MPHTYEVTAEWDEAAGVWIATSEDVPGLCAQAASFDELAEVVAALVPELLTLNAAADLPATVPVHLTAHRIATVRVHA